MTVSTAHLSSVNKLPAGNGVSAVERFVAVFEMIGGVYAVAAALLVLGSTAMSPQDADAQPVLYFLIAGVCSTFAGYRLWSGRPDGTRLSTLVLTVQVPVVVTSFLQFSTFLLLRIAVQFVQGSLGIKLDYGGELFVQLQASAIGPQPVIVGINVLPILLLVMLRRQAARKTAAPTVGS